MNLCARNRQTNRQTDRQTEKKKKKKNRVVEILFIMFLDFYIIPKIPLLHFFVFYVIPEVPLSFLALLKIPHTGPFFLLDKVCRAKRRLQAFVENRKKW